MPAFQFVVLVALMLVALVALVVLLVMASRASRRGLSPELLVQLQRLEAAVDAARLSGAKTDGVIESVARQLDGASAAQAQQVEALRKAVDGQLAQAVDESRSGRTELSESLRTFGADVQAALTAMSGALRDQLEGNGTQIRNQFVVLQDALSGQHGALVQGAHQSAEQLRTTLNERLAAIQADNTDKLEKMRLTVDEKLHATLEQRLGESFRLVSERLEQVQKGLGEMQVLASSVGDLKRVMTNVKSRGTWGEVQLGAIIDDVLTPDQYGKNVKTVPGSDELVEFAIRLPGRRDTQPVWLPIDSKYPVEHYQRLMDAHECADKAAIVTAGNALEASVRLEAKRIASKYISPPHTTDFAILYLPTESLFAETLRRPGLIEALQHDHRVMVTGPANLAAMLNSLQMGFKTLAIEKRSSEVWSVLGQVKTEFSKFGDVVEATKKSIEQAAKKFDDVGVRTRAIQRKLRDVQDMPLLETGGEVALLAAPDADDA